MLHFSRSENDTFYGIERVLLYGKGLANFQKSEKALVYFLAVIPRVCFMSNFFDQIYRKDSQDL